MTPEPELRADELSAILETAHEAFVSIDEDGRVIGWNREAERTFGWSKQAALGQCLRDLIIPHRYRERHDAGLQHFLATGEGPLLDKRIEITALHRSGGEFPVELTISPLRQGGVWRFNAFIRDISERYRASEVQRRLATIVEHSADAIISRTRDGVISSWNPAAEMLFGYTAEEMMGKTMDRTVPQDRAGEVQELIARVLRSEAVYDFETIRRRRDGTTVDVSLTISPITDDAGLITELSMIARDISARKAGARALEAANAALAQTNELKAQFVAVASHELRTPLTSIVGFTTTLLAHWDRLREDEKLRFLRIVEQQAARLRRLADDVLVLSRISAAVSPERVPVDLGNLIGRVLEEQDMADATKVVLDGAAVIDSDPDRVHQILLNYAVNAKTYGERPYRVTVSKDERGDSVIVRVFDTGDGVDPAFAPHLFESFSRSTRNDDAPGGTGLGLAIVKGLAEELGGEAWYEPNEPKGACFCVRFPDSNA